MYTLTQHTGYFTGSDHYTVHYISREKQHQLNKKPPVEIMGVDIPSSPAASLQQQPSIPSSDALRHQQRVQLEQNLVSIRQDPTSHLAKRSCAVCGRESKSKFELGIHVIAHFKVKDRVTAL